MKRVAVALSIFPGSLFVLALASFVICSIAELGLSGGSANIGLGLLLIALIINIPTIAAWVIFVARREGTPMLERSESIGEQVVRGKRS